MDLGCQVAKLQDIGQSTVASLDRFETSSKFTEKERAALALCDAMSATPCRVEDALFERVSRHFSQRELVGLTAVIAWENYRARVNRAFALAPEGFFSVDHCAAT